MLPITSRQLVKNVWKVRGFVESHQLADRRFVLEFFEECDFKHVMPGRPWRYQEDVVLIRKLMMMEVPNMVRFESMPIWAQFAHIPFYLLSKKLTRNLGMNLGELICIDNNTRGNISDKILHAKIHLPIGRPL
jgi:hypothetical protein